MANRLLVLVLGAVVVTSLVVGGLLGMQLAGGGGDEPLTTTPATTSQPTATTVPTAMPTTSTAATETPSSGPSTATATPEQTFSPDSVNTTAVEYYLRTLVDEEVRTEGQSLGHDDEKLEEMAQFHADNMLEQGYPAHAAGGFSTRARYEKFDRYSHCRVPNDNNAGIRDGEELEVIGRVTLNLSEDPTEQEIAQQVLDDWSDDETRMERLSLVNAEDAGVGIAVSENARVYVTVDLC